MIPQRARYGKIKELTRGMLERSGIEAPPVPIGQLLQVHGIEVKFGDLGDVSGLIARRNGTTIVGINSDQPATRQRFTMAHELGHFILHPDLKSHSDVNYRVKFRNRTSSEATDVEEIEANFFAASILMPRHMLDAHSAAETLGDDLAVQRLAERFEVSVHAMSLRLANEYSHQRPF